MFSAKTLIPRLAHGQLNGHNKGQQKGKPQFLRQTDIEERAQI